MFENVSVKPYYSAEDIRKSMIYVNWTWVFNKDGEVPSCDVFCYCVSQDELMREFLFTKEEILEWFNQKVQIQGDDWTDNIRNFCNNPQVRDSIIHHPVRCGTNASIYNTYQLNLPNIAKDNPTNKVYLICVFNKEKIETFVTSIKDTKPIYFNYEKKGKTFGLFGKEYLSLSGIVKDSKQKVMIINQNGMITYSLIPPNMGDEYFYPNMLTMPEDKRRINIAYLYDMFDMI